MYIKKYVQKLDFVVILSELTESNAADIRTNKLYIAGNIQVI